MSESLETTTEVPGIVFRQAPPITNPTELREQLVKAREGITVGGQKTDVVSLKTPPFSIYENIRKHPYSVEYFELGPEWEYRNHPKEIAFIEDFVKGEIKAFRLTDSIDSYKEIIDSLENKIGRRENEKPWSRLDRLTSYIRALQNVRKWQVVKQGLEASIG